MARPLRCKPRAQNARSHSVTYKKESPMKNHLVNLALGIAAGLALSAALYGPIVLGAAQ